MLYITLRQYEYLVAVAQTSNLTEAARFLNVSQPSLSVAITRIEDRMGQQLFTRGKGVPFRATAYGRTVVDHAKSLLEQAARLETAAGLASARPLRAKIGFFDDLAPRWLASTLAVLGAGFPLIDFSPVVGGFAELERSLLSGDIDLALTYDLGLDASHERHVVARISPYAFVPAADVLAESDRVSLKQLAARPLVLFDDGLSIQHMLKLFDERGLRPHVVQRTTSLEVMRSLAAHGKGIGISYTNPPSMTSYDGRPLATVRVADRLAVEPIVLTWPAGRSSDLPLTKFLNLVRQTT